MLTIGNARAMLGLGLILALAIAGCATQTPLSADQLTALLSAPDRSSTDKDNDTRRKARDMPG